MDERARELKIASEKTKMKRMARGKFITLERPAEFETSTRGR